MMQTLRMTVGGVMAMFVLSGCSPHLSLTQEEGMLEPCVDITEVVDLVSVSRNTRPTCDVGGLEMVFPDGYSMTAPAIGHTAESLNSNAPGEYHAVNVGVYGIAAAVRNEQGEVTWFGNESAVERRHAALGIDF